MRTARFVLAVLLCGQAQGQFLPSSLPPVGYHPSNITYFNTPYYANALFHGGEWYSFTNFEFGTPVGYSALPSQFVNGYPQFLNSGQRLRAPLFGLNIEDPFRPQAWPDRARLARGRIVVTWNGTADIRLATNCALVAAESPSGATGSVTNGRRVYQCATALQTLEVHAIGTPAPSEVRVWLANGTDSLEGQLFHPLLLQRIADRNWAWIRFMDWTMTNASPVVAWADRRLPAHIFMTGIINDRSPALNDEVSPGNRETGVAYEHVVALCNATGKDLWINVPHLASADFMTRLAKLIRFGSDGVNPYDAPNPSPVHPPLDVSRKVYVEYSNEIWSSGFAFPQGNWAEAEAVAAGLGGGLEGKARFNARKFADSWSIFQSVFAGQTSRLVRVAATFTANDTYTNAFMNELATYGPTRTPAVQADVLAVTTYFGNGIQDFVNQQGFTAGKLFDDPYWESQQFAADQTTAFTEWKRRVMAGDAVQGSGPDATGIGGGFSGALRNFGLPIIAYEGGPSLFTDNIDGNAQNASGVPTDDGVTTFIEAMNRDVRIADVYRIHLETARSKGLRTHTPYLDTSIWSRFGQWGHLETIDSLPAASPKYALMLEHFDTYSTLRHIDDVLGTAPQFVTNAILPVGIAGQPYSTTITTSGGEGTLTATVVGALLESTLSVSAGGAPGTIAISGTPQTSRKNFIFVRVHDGDGDPAWRVFTLQTFGGLGTLVQSDFRGTDPALNRPWTPTFVLSPNVTWSGWNTGAGATPRSGSNAFVFSVSGSTTENESLAQSITDNQFLTATVTPVQGPLDLRGGEIRFSTRRITFHAPLGYALFSSISGFAQANALYVSSSVSKDNFDEIEHVVTIPSIAAYSAVNAPLELRIVAFGAQFDGHTTSLTGFKLTQSAAVAITAPSNLVATATSSTSVSLSWSPVMGTVYEVFRRSAGVAESKVADSGAASFIDTVGAGTTHVYRVRATAGGSTSAFSNADLATTVVFTDDPLVAGTTPVKALHLSELRIAVNAVRACAGLSAASFATDPSITAGGTAIRAAHVGELRDPLTEALGVLGFGAAFSGGLSPGLAIQAMHFQELRTAAK